MPPRARGRGKSGPTRPPAGRKGAQRAAKHAPASEAGDTAEDGGRSVAGRKRSAASVVGSAAGPKAKAKAPRVQKPLSTEASSSSKSIVVRLGEVLTCDPCKASSQDVTWAAYQSIQSEGRSVEQPVGPGCERCYRKAIDILHFPNYPKFLSAYHGEESVRVMCESIDKNQDKAGSHVTWPREESCRSLEFDIEVCKEFDGFSERAFKNKLGVTRLSAKAIDGLPEVMAPSLESPGEKVQMWLCERKKEPDPEATSIKIVARSKHLSMTELLGRSANLYAGQGSDEMRHQMLRAEDHGCAGFVRAMTCKDLATIDDVVENHGNLVASRASRKSLGGAALKGAAAKEFGDDIMDVAEADETGHLMLDLTDDLVKTKMNTPKKKGSVILAEGSLVDGSDEEMSEEEAQPGDWVAYWKRKLPIRALWVGRPKGRSVKALRERCDTLVEFKGTRPTGVLLGKYHEKVKMAVEWRGGAAISGLTDAELEKGLKAWEEEEAILTADICQAVLNRKAENLATNQQWEAWVSVMIPISEDGETPAWNPRAPTMVSLPRVESWRIAAFIHAFVEKLIGPMLFEGSDASSKVRDIMDRLETRLRGMDEMMMSKAGAGLLIDLRDISLGLQTVIDLPFSSCYAAHVEAMSASGAKRPGPVDKMRSTLCLCDWYHERIQKFLNAVPFIESKEAAWMDYDDRLDKFDKCETVESILQWVLDLQKMHDDYSAALQAVDVDSVQVFGARLLTVTLAVGAAWLEKIPATNPDDVHWSHFAAMLTSASIAYPLDSRIPEMLTNMNGTKAKTIGESNLADFESMLLEMVATATIQDSECNKLIQLAQRCKDLELSQSCKDNFGKALEVAVTCVLDGSNKVSMETCMTLLGDLLRYVDKNSAWLTIHDHMKNMDKLAAFAAFLAPDADLGNVCVKDFRKCMEEVKSVAKQNKNYDGVSSTLSDKIHEMLQHMADTYGDVNAKMLKAALGEAMSKYYKAKEDLADIAYGSKGIRTSWTDDLRSNIALDELLKKAEEAELFSISVQSRDEVLALFLQQFDGFKKAVEDAGQVMEEAETEAKEALHQRAVITIAEQIILQLVKTPKESTIARNIAQGAIRRIRGVKLKEKEVFKTSLYKWSFSTVTGR